MYLLEGVNGGRVRSQGQGKLQHVQLDGAEQGTGFLHYQLIVGLVCVCVGTTSHAHTVNTLSHYHYREK